jgi:hypothetical protein
MEAVGQFESGFSNISQRRGLLTNHAYVLVCVAHDPGIRLRDIAPKLAGRLELLVRLAAS